MAALRTKTANSLQEYISYIEKLRANHKDPLWYRGSGKASYKLLPSLYRHQQSKTIEEYIDLEKHLLSRFQQRSIPFHSRAISSAWEWLFFMQHYGVPTRMLDWSESPLMALFFAVTSARHRLSTRGCPVFYGDATVWILSPTLWNKHAVNLKSFLGCILTTEDVHASAYKPVGDINTMKDLPIALYGSHNSQRIVAQRGVFVCFGKDTRPMEDLYENDGFPSDSLLRLVVKKKHLPDMYEALKRHGITDSVVFPDLDGLSREIKREFFFEV
jgi:hypothetical protein